MSAGVIALLSCLGYLLVGIGVARQIYARTFAMALKRKRDLYSDRSIYGRVERRATMDQFGNGADDPTVLLGTLFGGVFWPLTLVWLVALRPIGTVVWPMFRRWWVAPARAKAKELEVES